jgi:hypothetical protein
MKIAANRNWDRAYAVTEPTARYRESRMNTVPVVFCAMCGAVLVLISRKLSVEIPPSAIIWSTVCILLALCAYHRRVAIEHGENPWISPFPLTMNYFFVRYGLGALVVYYWDSYPWEALPALKMRFYEHGGRQNLEPACQLLLLGAFGLSAAASLPARRIARLLPAIRWSVDRDKFRRNVVLYLPVGLFVLLLGARELSLTLQFAASIFGTIIYPLAGIISYWLFSARSSSERAHWIAVLSALCGLSLLLGLISGLISEMLLPFAMALFGYIIARRSPPWKALLLAGPPIFFFVFPFLTIYKYSTQQSASDLIGDRLAGAREKLQFTNYRMGFEMTLDRFVARMALAEFPAIFSRFYPEVYPYAEGATFLKELSVLVPRVIWPDKPLISYELNHYSAAVGLIHEGDKTSAVFDAVSEYHLNFGPGGVFLLFVLHGLYLSVLYSWLNVNVEKYLASSLFAALFIFNNDFFGVGQLFTSHVKILPVWILLLYFMSRKRTGARRAAVTYSRTI